MITWNTDVNAPCCPGEIVNGDGRTLLIQLDWDYPATASSFGWWLGSVQRCKCGRLDTAPIWIDRQGKEVDDTSDRWQCAECGEINDTCDHDSTDGTVDCGCGVTALDFITTAGEWLRNNDGATADDPGYFA